MKSIVIKFQTSELIPPPYAYAIELKLEPDEKLSYDLDLEYIDREDLSEEDIYEEGFTTEDDIKVNGILPSPWVKELQFLMGNTKFIQKTNLYESEDLWIIETDGKTAYPENFKKWEVFLEQIRQAILEDKEIEEPLKIKVVQIKGKDKLESELQASFRNLDLSITKNGEKENLPWKKLLPMLKSVYSGEFDYHHAQTKLKNKPGTFFNFGDEYWFELGKSYFNNPSNIKQFL